MKKSRRTDNQNLAILKQTEHGVPVPSFAMKTA